MTGLVKELDFRSEVFRIGFQGMFRANLYDDIGDLTRIMFFNHPNVGVIHLVFYLKLVSSLFDLVVLMLEVSTCSIIDFKGLRIFLANLSKIWFQPENDVKISLNKI